jgi:hypothetical protein
MVRWAITKGWDVFPSFWGVKQAMENLNRESNGAWSLDGHQSIENATTNQKTVSVVGGG